MSALANAFRLKMLAQNQQGRPDFASSFAGAQLQQPQGANPYAPAAPRPFAMPQQPGPVAPGPQMPQEPPRWTPPQVGPLQPVPRVSPELQAQQQAQQPTPIDQEAELRQLLEWQKQRQSALDASDERQKFLNYLDMEG